jgi:hypothetical protein
MTSDCGEKVDFDLILPCQDLADAVWRGSICGFGGTT